MNEFSCIIVIAFGAARPGAAPNIAPAPASPVIFSTSRRDADRMRLAIPFSLRETGIVASRGARHSAFRRYGAAIGEVNLAALTRTEPAASVRCMPAPRPMALADPLPISVLTGFLGSGKTT